MGKKVTSILFKYQIFNKYSQENAITFRRDSRREGSFMKLITIFVTLIAILSVPSFSQNNTGGNGMPDLDGIPNDQPPLATSAQDILDRASDAMKAPLKKKGTPAQELKKKVAFIRINHYAKKLVKEVSHNVVKHCQETDPKILGLKSLIVYLEKKELSEMVKLNAINEPSSQKQCRVSAFSCVFQADTLKTLSKLIHDPYFNDYLIDEKNWKKSNAEAVSKYLKQVEGSLKPKP